MRGDFSRLTFDPKRSYDAVLAQQGRVTVDADINEQHLSTLHRLDASVRDLLGSSGAPRDFAGFDIRFDGSDEFTIGAGRYYVNGVLVENSRQTEHGAQAFDYSPKPIVDLLREDRVSGALVYLEVWRRFVTALDDPKLADTALGGADTATRLQAVWQVKALPITHRSVEHSTPELLEREADFDRTLGEIAVLSAQEHPIHRAFADLDALTAELSAGSERSSQQHEEEFRSHVADLIATGHEPGGLAGLVQRAEAAGMRWLHHLGGAFVHRETELKERLGDVSRTIREQFTARDVHRSLDAAVREMHTVSETEFADRLDGIRSKLHPLDHDGELTGRAKEMLERLERHSTEIRKAPKLSDIRGTSRFREWEQLRRRRPTTLAVRVAGAGAQSVLENQLYRVEIHDPGHLGNATFVWSRENGSIVFGIRDIEGGRVTLDRLVIDERSGLAPRQWVELSDDGNEFEDRAGEIIQIADVDASEQVIVLEREPKHRLDMTRHPRLRRWDSLPGGTVPTPLREEQWIPLEAGIEVRFSGTDYRHGDFWTIVSRENDVAFECPADDSGRIALSRTLRRDHGFAELALVTVGAGGYVVDDRRRSFAPLAVHAASLISDENGHHPPTRGDQTAIHIVHINWWNDREFERFTDEGLQISFDTAPARVCAQRRAVRVTLEPYPRDEAVETPRGLRAQRAQAMSYVLRALKGAVELTGKTLHWRPAPAFAQGLSELQSGADTDRFLIRVFIRGADIWTDEFETTAYGAFHARQEPRGDAPATIALRFPSGPSEMLSDFESWFFINAS